MKISSVCAAFLESMNFKKVKKYHIMSVKIQNNNLLFLDHMGFKNFQAFKVSQKPETTLIGLFLRTKKSGCMSRSFADFPGYDSTKVKAKSLELRH